MLQLDSAIPIVNPEIARSPEPSISLQPMPRNHEHYLESCLSNCRLPCGQWSLLKCAEQQLRLNLLLTFPNSIDSTYDTSGEQEKIECGDHNKRCYWRDLVEQEAANLCQ